jgi:hypothetical protein
MRLKGKLEAKLEIVSLLLEVGFSLALKSE